MMFIRGLRWLAVWAIAVGLTFAGPARAIEPADVQTVVGAWDLNLDATSRKCRIILRNDVVASGYALAMPSGCRRAMPVLAEIAGWSTEANSLTFTNLSGSNVLRFSLGQDGSLQANGPDGETYSLVPTDPKRKTQFAAVVAAGVSSNPPSAIPAFQTAQTLPSGAAPAAPLKPAELPGRYSIWREGPKDTGCMLTLDDKARGSKGLKAVLSPACRDQGMVIFDPTGWNVERNRLVLTARKGHQAHFDRQSDGSWTKDPKDGKGLVLKKM
jgi:hypothetical protein